MMDSPDSPLVLTKLRVPVERPRNLPRPRLVDLLVPENGASFILVCAPAGYGKTTLLAEWAHALLKKGCAVAWYALDPGDDDPIPFSSYLVASFIQALGPIPEMIQTAQFLRSSPEIELPRLLPLVINAVLSSGRECVLILDDYHLISMPAIHSAVAYLLEHLPENLCIAIGSRSDPPLPLARLRARRQLFEVRAAGLRFTTEETARFLNEVMRLELSPEGVATLEERTEGWVAGLQLAALSLSGRADRERFIASFTGSHRYLVEYLLEEVVDRQPAEVQSFLLATSILERMCAPLCDALFGQAAPGEGRLSQSEAILKQLEQANLFVVALDDQEYWYRYHHLFRDFLQSRLNKTRPEGAATLHRAACEWLAANQFLREAARHAFQTQDWEYAATFVEQHSFTMVIHSEMATMYEWCLAFPEEVMQRHPMLCIMECYAPAFSFRRQIRDRVEHRLEQAEQIIATMEDRQAARELTESASIVRTFLAMAPDPAADPRPQLALAQEMMGYYPEGEAGQFSALLTTGYAYLALYEAQAAQQAIEKARQSALSGRLYFGIMESTFHLARLVHCQGHLERAAQICRQGQADIAGMLAHPEQELPALGCLDIALGCVLLEQGHLDEAEQHLLHGLDLIGWGMNPYYLMAAYLALFQLREIQGRTAEAFQYLARLEAAWPDIAFCTGGFRALHALKMAPQDPTALADALAWCKTFSPASGEEAPLPGMGPFGAAEAYYLAGLAWARVQIAAGSPQAALLYLNRQLAMAETNGLTNRMIEILLLETLALQATGDHQGSFAALERALEAARAEGYLRIFDQGPGLSRLLAEAARRGICPDYIGPLLCLGVTGMAKTPSQEREGVAEQAGASSRPPSAFSLASGECLSQRELEVLRLMAGGASNQAIAKQLFITVGTVKSHINHILGKLGAGNRTEAVAYARGLGWLDI